MDDLTVATILESLTKGIAGHMERSAHKEREDKEFALKKMEIEERAKDRQATHEQNALYRQAMLGQKQTTGAADLGIKEGELEVKRGELARKTEEGEENKVLRAGDQLKRYSVDKQKLDKRLSAVQAELESSPDDPNMKAQAIQLQNASNALGREMVAAKIAQRGVKKEIAPFLEQLSQINDPAQGKALIDQLLKSKRFHPESKEMDLLLKDYVEKFGNR